MKKSLAAFNIIFVVALLFSSYTLYTAVEPILTGKVTIEMQDEKDIDWEFTNDTVSAHTWVRIVNGGNYEISGTKLHIWIVHNESGFRLLDMTQDIPTVAAGQSYKHNLDISLDVNSLPEEIKDRLWTEYANFTVYADINAYFMNKGGDLLVHYHNTIQWEPLLKYLNIDSENTTISYDSGTREMDVFIPYSLATSSLLLGNADILVKVYNGTSVLSSTRESIPLGQDYYGVLRFNISEGDTYYLMTHSMNIPVVATVAYSGISMDFTENYSWGAPFDRLSVGDIQSSGNTVSIQYSFINDYSRDLQIAVHMDVYDSSGSIVGTQDDHYTAYRGSTTSRSIRVSLSGYPSYALITVTENVSGWHYTIRRDA